MPETGDPHKRKEEHRLLHGAEAALGIGAGLYGTQHAMFDDDSRARLQRFVGAAGRIAADKDPVRSLDGYVQEASRVSGAKLFGQNSTDVMRFVRRFALDPKDRWNADSQNHYSQFRRGPLSAYMEEVSDSVGPSNFPENPRLADGLNNHKLRGAVEDAISRVAPAYGLPEDADRLNPAQQQKLYPLIDADIRKHDPAAWSRKHLADAAIGNTVVRDDAESYRDCVVNPLLKLHGAMRVAAPALMAVGAAGLSVAAIKALREHRRKKSESQAMVGTPALA